MLKDLKSKFNALNAKGKVLTLLAVWNAFVLLDTANVTYDHSTTNHKTDLLALRIGKATNLVLGDNAAGGFTRNVTHFALGIAGIPGEIVGSVIGKIASKGATPDLPKSVP